VPEQKERTKIHVMSNVNMDVMKAFLEKACPVSFPPPEIKFSGYNQYMQDILNPSSELYKFSPDYILFFLDGNELYAGQGNRIFFAGLKEAEKMTEEKIGELGRLLSMITSRLHAKILINTLVLNPCHSFTLLEFNNRDRSFVVLEHLYNCKISGLSDARIFIVDFNSLCRSFGYRNLYDQRLWYIGRIKLSQKGLHELARLYFHYMAAIEGKVKKCIVLDLDNTLWGGIIGEDGIGGIRLGHDGIGRAFVEFQEELLKLKQQGVLLAVNSKNNFNDVREVFESHPAMVLKFDDFVSVKANWDDKITNMKEIAGELNIGMDSFVFIDDSDFERELVKKELPMIVVPDFPKDPAFLSSWLIDVYQEFFPRVKLSQEDLERTQMYKAQAQREQVKKAVRNIEDFLKQLEMKATIYINPETLIPRIAQLTQKTNQFNLTTKRYSEADIQAFMETGNFIFALDLSDRFGPNGVTGLIMIRITDQSLFIDNFLLSCRVIGREVERVFIGFVINWIGKQGLKQKKIHGAYVPTQKNGMVADLYDRLGFAKTADHEWVWDVGKAYALPALIEIEKVVPDGR
jgi:FkbH-like protein